MLWRLGFVGGAVGSAVFLNARTAHCNVTPVPKAHDEDPSVVIARNLEKFKQRCAAGTADACHVLGMLFLQGHEPVQRDTAAGLSYISQACEAGHAPSCTVEGRLYIGGGKEYGVTQNYKRGLVVLEKACTKKDGSGCTALGECYRSGLKDQVNEDKDLATKYFKLGCAYDDGEGCFWGAMFAYDNKDFGAGHPMMEKGCRLKSGHACLALGERAMSEEGPLKAAHYFAAACKHNSAQGCEQLAMCYLTGQGTRKDEERAVAYFNRACKGESASACKRLALCLAQGTGIDKNEATAKVYLEKSLRLEAQMQAQLMEAQRDDAKDAKKK